MYQLCVSPPRPIQLTCTRTKLSLFRYPFSLRIRCSSDEMSTVTWTIKFRIPALSAPSLRKLSRHTLLLFCRQGLPFLLDQLLQDLQRDVLAQSAQASPAPQGERKPIHTLVFRLLEVSSTAGTRCHASGFSWNWVKTR